MDSILETGMQWLHNRRFDFGFLVSATGRSVRRLTGEGGRDRVNSDARAGVQSGAAEVFSWLLFRGTDHEQGFGRIERRRTERHVSGNGAGY